MKDEINGAWLAWSTYYNDRLKRYTFIRYNVEAGG
jgi:hypothetical protein